MKIFYKIIFLFCFVMVMQFELNAQQSVTWEKLYTYGTIHRGIQTSDGGYIATGTISIPNKTYTKIFVIKTNSLGDTLWYKTYGSLTYYYDGFWIDESQDRGFFIAGAGDGPLGDAYLLKIDSIGNFQWSRSFGGNNHLGGII